MAVSIPRSLVEYILLGPAGDRRQLQDSPVLGDVWIAYAKDPRKSQELLITPHNAWTAGSVAIELDTHIAKKRKSEPKQDDANIAYLQGIIAARLYFDEVLQVVVPATEWWISPLNKKELQIYRTPSKAKENLNKMLEIASKMVLHWSDPVKNPRAEGRLSALDRYAALAGIILWARGPDGSDLTTQDEPKLAESIGNAIADIAKDLIDLFNRILREFPLGANQQRKALVYQVSLNRQASIAVSKSVPAVKADAARTLFTVNSANIAWAVIDAGIQGDHLAFKGADGKSRVQKSFDFSNFRKIVSLDNLKIFGPEGDEERRGKTLASLLHDSLRNRPDDEKAKEYLMSLATDMRNKRPIHWEFVEPFIEIKTNLRPASDHGCHVAGIIGASKDWAKKLTRRQLPADEAGEYVDGMCPDIALYDFRVLAESDRETEFAIIAALQYIRYMNERNDFITIHGANLSLSIPHDVRNYACGRTPVCVECERLVDSGVVVVTAAGNFGYQSFTTKEGSYESYAAFSITDPGNADGVITVGATHRFSPHTYGVSFFSSRGPTGDGRLKPDLVAPGERIRAPFRESWGDLDGTSMAAPHVSGAAAMLMARYSELIGQPRRIKRILCESATDLGRERSFQGHGMLDVLRAFQSI